MWFTEWINLLVLLAFVSTMCSGEENGVTIEVVYKPEECTRKTKDGDYLAMEYTGRLEKDGSVFDSSHKRQRTFDFILGRGQVIQGWEKGLQDMCVGEKRKLRVPSYLGYGNEGVDDVIPPGANLLFDVELKEIKNDGEKESEAYPNVFSAIDKDKNKELSIEEVKKYLEEQDGFPNEDDTHRETILSEIFENEDKDKDGVISHEEFSGPKQDHVEL